MNYETIKEFYDLELWTKIELHSLVLDGDLTQAEYDSIVGIAPVEPKTPITPPTPEVQPVG